MSTATRQAERAPRWTRLECGVQQPIKVVPAAPAEVGRAVGAGKVEELQHC